MKDVTGTEQEEEERWKKDVERRRPNTLSGGTQAGHGALVKSFKGRAKAHRPTAVVNPFREKRERERLMCVHTPTGLTDTLFTAASLHCN